MRRLGTVGMASVLLLCAQMPVAAAETAAEKMERLERQLDELRQEIQELKKQQSQSAAPAPAAQAPAAGPPAAQAAAQPAAAPTPPAETAKSDWKQGILGRVQIGGYGSTRFEANSATNENTTFTLRRLVLTGDAAIAPRLRAYFELEFERFRELELETHGGLGERRHHGRTERSRAPTSRRSRSSRRGWSSSWCSRRRSAWERCSCRSAAST